MMATPETGLIGVAILLALLLAGTPIAAALGLVGIGGLVLMAGPEGAVIKAGVVFTEALSKYELGTLPLFLLMAHLCFSANASRDFFEAAARLFGHRRGGLAYASVAGCAAFGAINGSSLATAATVGMVAVPEMRKRGYDDGLATGVVAAGGTLGQMIPPSGALIVFGIIAEQSIGTLFTAAIIPGITQLLLYVAAIFVLTRFRPNAGPATPRAPWSERFEALARIGDVVLLVVAVIGGIALGWLTPSEAAAAGAVGGFILCAVRGQLRWSVVETALRETLRTSGLIYAVVIGAMLFSTFIAVSGLGQACTDFILGLNAGQLATIAAIAILLLLLGSVLDGLALMLLTTPILLPVIEQLGLSPIWFGIFLVRAMEIGFVHPPLGMNLYVIQGIARDVPIGRIFIGVIPFLIADLIHLSLLAVFPAIALALPEALSQ